MIPTISIGMPVFNDKQFLRKAIDSLLGQSFTAIKLIISDDCSSDGSAEICRSYAAADPRVTYIRQDKNIGISRNMEFLLDQARGEYFMWAANDDVWDRDFIGTLLEGFRQNPAAVSSFCPYVYINEKDESISTARFFDFSGASACERIRKLVRLNDDGFGYGLFRTEFIRGVKFPVWWWINAKCAYNNIYPTLCYYLVKGDYVLTGNKPLWLNRMKEEVNVNHKIPYVYNFTRGYLAFCLRKFNLVTFSLGQVIRAEKGLKTFFCVLPRMTYSWFIIPSLFGFKSWFHRYRKKEISFW
jgi:glycosyltransferase involved in cell wall biosynthesis